MFDFDVRGSHLIVEHDVVVHLVIDESVVHEHVGLHEMV